jgi:exopolyphosphatase/guanosine-5'-triphosphate,3'-diphosphate pyrophosphatase
MVCACIDIGTNTTRLLVAEPTPGGLRELLALRVFTRVRRALGPDGAIAAPKLRELADVVAAQARAARDLGAARIDVVATAVVRFAPNRAELAAELERRAGLPLRVLPAAEEARLAFVGATRTWSPRPAGPVAVIDLGGGSTELAVGTVDGGVAWSTSVPVGSAELVDEHVRGDPPAAAEVAALRAAAAAAFAAVRPPPADLALAVGGSATSMHRLCGAVLDAPGLGAALAAVTAGPCAEVARRHALDPERVRLLPGGLAVLEQAARILGTPLAVSRGGLREGIILSAIDQER